jgi:hypothetical protein
MGRDRVDFTVRASLSRHNSAQDEIDEQRWADLRQQIEDLCMQYKDIDAEAYS